jgi:hypothetical protein
MIKTSMIWYPGSRWVKGLGFRRAKQHIPSNINRSGHYPRLPDFFPGWLFEWTEGS